MRKEKDMKFNWQDSKFGMFIHWGLYAKIGKGEWYMMHSKTPVAEYEKIASEFNPVNFNAKEWVGLAKAAGMKYIVITAKHHDGFAMFDSKADSYNIMERTPFKRDPMKELQLECDKQGIQLCFYYSHVIDWHHPHALHESANNTWDYKLSDKDFYIYWNEKSKRQVRELLENYGDIGLLWFDTAGDISEEDSLDMYNLVKEIQPGCLVNSRLSHVPNMGDYSEKGDNEIPALGEDSRAWQTPMTINNSWGFEFKEQHLKSTKLLIYKLINIISKGGNFLLNVGPTAEGIIPEEQAGRLKEIGEWIEAHKEAIYETSRTPFPYEHSWGGITAKDNKLYLHIFNDNIAGQSNIAVAGIKNCIRKAYFLSNGIEPGLERTRIDELELDMAEISFPDGLPDAYVTTVVLELDGNPDIDQRLIQQQWGVNLDLASARIIDKQGEEDIDGGKTASWDFLVLDCGEYTVDLVNFKRINAEWDYGEISLSFNGSATTIIPAADYIEHDSPSCQHPYEQVYSRICNISVDKPGLYSIMLKGGLVGKKARGFEAWQAPAYRIRSLLIRKK